MFEPGSRANHTLPRLFRNHHEGASYEASRKNSPFEVHSIVIA